MAEKLGCQAIHFLPMMPIGRGAELNDQILSAKEVLLLSRHFGTIQISKKIRIVFKKFLCLEPFDYGNSGKVKVNVDPGCPAGIASFAISPVGDVSGCVLINRVKDYIVGNVKENNLDEIWYNSDFFNEIRHLDEKKNLFPSPCNSCIYFANCKGGCLIEKLLFNNSLYSQERYLKELIMPSSKVNDI